MPRFPRRGPSGSRSRASPVLSRHYDFLPSVSPRFVSFVWRYHPLCRSLRVSRRSRHGLASQAVSVRHPLRSRVRGWRRQDLPSSWETPIVHRRMFFDPGRPRASHQSDAAPRPPLRETRGRRHWDFRGSIAWHLDWLSTLRSGGCPTPRKTRFQWLVRPSWAGLNPQGSYGRISICFLTSLPPSPSSLGAMPATLLFHQPDVAEADRVAVVHEH
jgi:hypothetical protein